MSSHNTVDVAEYVIINIKMLFIYISFPQIVGKYIIIGDETLLHYLLTQVNDYCLSN